MPPRTFNGWVYGVLIPGLIGAANANSLRKLKNGTALDYSQYVGGIFKSIGRVGKSLRGKKKKGK